MVQVTEIPLIKIPINHCTKNNQINPFTEHLFIEKFTVLKKIKYKIKFK